MATIDILGVPHAYNLTEPTVSGHTLVFIHGWLLSRGYWQPVIKQLTPEHQCLCYDLRGFGDSQPVNQLDGSDRPIPDARESNCYKPAAYAEDLAILLQRLKIESAWLIGHSLGGTIALWVASQSIDCVRGVICVNSGGGIYLQEEFERFRAVGEQLVKRRPKWLCQLPLIDLLFARFQVARPIDRCWGRQMLIDFVVAHPDAALGALLDSTTEEEVHRLPQLVSQLKQPVYFIAGALDEVMNPKYVRHLASFHWMFQNGDNNVVEIPDCGHLSMVEHPDTVVSEIRSILANHG